MLRDFRERLEGPSVYFPIVIILVALVSFGFGRLSLMEEKKVPVAVKGGLKGEPLAPRLPADAAAAAVLSGGAVSASKNGTKYYFPWCSGLSRIKKENLVSFASAKEAEAAGYALAANCAAR